MLDDLRPAHEVLSERIGEHALNYERAPKFKPEAIEEWSRFTECCTILYAIVIPGKCLAGMVNRLRGWAERSKDEEVASQLHQLANDLERQLESQTPQSV